MSLPLTNKHVTGESQRRCHGQCDGECHGEGHGNSKYTEEQALLVINFTKLGYSRKDIMEAVGVTMSFVKDIRHNRAWKHLER